MCAAWLLHISHQLRHPLHIYHLQSVLPRGPDEQVADCVAQSLWVEIEDSPTANLLSEFPQTSEFVREALASGGRVLVRCAQGVSRSVAVRLAFAGRS